jgi:superfamily II DNA helicase RecQ
MEFCWDARPAAGSRKTERKKIRSNRGTLTADTADNCFCLLRRYGVFVCREHATGVRNLDAHLRDYHAVPATERRAIVEKYSGFQIKGADEIPLPLPMGRPIEELGKPLDGFQCAEDGCDYITTNKDVLRKHCKKQHGLQWTKESGDLYTEVKVQTFFRTGGLQRYFIVNDREDAGAGRLLNNNPGDVKVEVDALLGEWKKTEVKHEKKMQVMDADVAKTDRTGWFSRTGWLQHLAKCNRMHLAHAIKLPNRNEPKLKRAARIVELLIERSVAGLSTLARETRRWLRSAQREEIDRRPLARLQNPESQARYAGYMVMFVCYFLRIIANEEARAGSSSNSDTSITDENTSDSSTSNGEGSSDDSSRRRRRRNRRRRERDLFKDARKLFPWQGRQKELAEELWLALDSGDEDKQMQALLLALASFIFKGTGDDPFSSGLIHFLAVLGIDAEMDRLRTAKNYSYMLAGVVYCTRVIAVEALLPSAMRREQGVADRDDFLSARKQFLADGSYSPMSEMISLLAYGKFVALNAGNSGNAYWSRDKKTFYLGGRPIVISQFQQMARDIVSEAADMLWQELLWAADPAERFLVKLDKIIDDVTFTKRGVSFVNRDENSLNGGLEWMLRRVIQTDGAQKLRPSTKAWKVKQVKRYLRRVDYFLGLMLIGVHITSGQPGRGSEVTTMRHRNGVLQDRNVFVVDGQVMTVVRYHKSQSQWDKPKVVPRFLPWRLGQVMAVYLAYLQPFQEYLTVQVLGGSFSDYVWADEHGPWGTDRLTRILKRETAKRLGTPLTTLDYRHTAVGIGRVVVGEGFGRGYQDEVGEIEEAEIDEEGESALELQSARTTAMGVSNYSVPADIVKHLSIRSMDTFRPLSELWHRFLGLASSQQEDEKRSKSSDSWLEKGSEKRGHAEDDAPEHRLTQLAPQRKRRAEQISRSEEQLHKAMQQALGRSEVSFKSYEQERAMHAVVAGQTPLVVVLPTGGGKSLLFMVPACLDDPGATIVVVPYRALIDDLVKRIRGSGIDCVEWKHGEANPAAVVVVSADVAGESDFLKYAVLLSGAKLLRRVVVDECHLIFTSSNWRPRLAKLRNLRILSCPIVLLTATLPPVLEEDLGESMLVRCATYIRACTARPNIRYTVSWCGRGKSYEIAIGICRRQRRMLRNGKKGVIYCNSKTQCEEIAAELRCLYYHAEVVDRAARLEAWVKKGGWMVATSALGTGVDFPGVVFVLHVGMPWSMIDFAQESGRGGRAGEMVDSVIVVEDGQVERRVRENSDSIDVQAMGLFIQGTGCRRGLMSEYLDGKRVECGDVEAAGCDRCGEGVAEWRYSQAQAAREWERVSMMMGELTGACAVCWVMGEAEVRLGSDHWRSHSVTRCRGYGGMTAEALDAFRRLVRYGPDSHSCMKCGVSQAYCTTGQDVSNKCQWPNVVIPVARAAAGLGGGIRMIREAGFRGELDGDYREYAIWLGKRHIRRVWGEFFSNAMVIAIRVISELEWDF